MKIKIGKVFILIFFLAFLFSIVSCSNSQDKAKITELEKKLADYQSQQTAVEEQITEVKEEEKQEELAETLPEKAGKSFMPTIEKDLYIQGRTNFTFVLDNYLYAGGQGINIFDIADKANPKLLGTVGNDWISELCVHEDYAYTTYSQQATNINKSGLKIIDVANKENPTEIANLNLDGHVYNIAVLDNYVFISYGIYGQQEQETGLKIVDTTNKSKPTFVKNIVTRKYGGGPFCISGESCYFLDGGNLKIIDLKDPLSTSMVRDYPLSLSADTVIADSGYLYFTIANTLQIVDLSSNSLGVIGGVFGRGYTRGIATGEDFACLSYIINDSVDNTYSIKESGLQIVDLSDKTQPFIATTIDISGEAAGVFVQDNYAYVAAGQNGVQIIKLFDK